ncbi:MAG TPA: M20/M25/M40 family metallo-hydrolase [Flavisolibacter sp.]|nr:M20/M25/M40 family metallo-hydrolase [Flavisolibacter sp.]
MKSLLLVIFIAFSIGVCAQSGTDVIDLKEIQRIETFLASDEMRGRRAGTPDIDKAADFISSEFRKIGLQPVNGNSYLQEFVMLRPKLLELKYKANDADVDSKGIIVITSQTELNVNEKSGYEMVEIKAGESLSQRARDIIGSKKNTIAYVDQSFEQNFSRLTSLNRQIFKSDHNTIFILGSQPKEFKIKADHQFESIRFANVVGMIPGKSRKTEHVIFSAHYDHVGIGKPVNGDSIYNGANDDAAGTTAVIALADHFKKLNNNQRTLIFAAFTAEEIGGYGSQYFSRQYNPKSIVAMFNIEMIGTESKWGKNSAFITGFEKTDMGQILQNNLKNSTFTFQPDPYPQQNLFYRSDNATLARLGVPAHTISTAKMENEPHYHKPSDEVETLDLNNMREIIKAIAISAKSIISGKDTPSRVIPESLR